VQDSDTYRESVGLAFSPRTVAIVGASTSGTGRTVVENFRRLDFDGQVVCVNPKYEEVLGFTCVPSLDDVPFVPDAVVLSVGRDRVVPMLEQAAAHGARSAVAFALGFAETDDEGRRLQRRLAEVAGAADMAFVGPNCQGLINFVDRVPLYMDSVFPYDAGHVGLIAESGSVVTALINNRRGVRWSHAASSGNEAVTVAGDILSYFVDRPEINVVCAYLEAIRRPDVFFAACDRAAELGKRIVVCASGRTAEAQAAATAHSGALALPHRMIRAALRRHGVITVDSLDELLETAIAMQSRRVPAGGRIAVLTASGGQIELVHDNLPGTGLSIPAFGDETKTELRGILAPFLPAHNPLDWWGTADPDENLPAIIRHVATDPDVDIVVQVGDFSFAPTGEDGRAGGALAAARKVKEERGELFVVVDGVGGTPTAAEVESALDDEILVLSGFDSGLRALGHLVAASRPQAPARSSSELAAARSAFGQAPAGTVAGATALDVLEAAGFDVVRRRPATSVEQARAAGEELGYPVVVKVADTEVAHKTEAGGVILGVSSGDELEAAAARLLSDGARSLLIEEQIRGGAEVLLGLESRPPLGTFLLVGLGGIWTEVLDDVALSPVGLRAGEARQLIQSLRGFPVLAGARGQQPADLDSLARALERLDDLALELGPELTSLDINPLIVLPDRAVVVDALFTKGQAGG
jgi:acetate---CoA ligase (ADP-forming)